MATTARDIPELAELAPAASGPLAEVRRVLAETAWVGPLVLLLALALPFFLATYPLFVVTQALIYGVVLVSLVVLTGYVGQVSLCQAAFMGLGAFLCAALMGNQHWSFWLAAPVAIALVFVAGLLVGLPALRLRGLTLAIVTLSLALVADNFLFQQIPWLTNGGNNWRLQRPDILGVSLDDTGALFRFVLVVVVLVLVAVVRLRTGRTGKSWLAMRDAEIAASTSGVPIIPMKLLGFGVAAALAALGGVLYALAAGAVSPQAFNFSVSVQLLAIAVIAGIRSIPGAVAGAFIYIILPQFLLQYPALVPLTPLILGAGLILQMIFAPQGIGGSFEQVQKRLRRSYRENSENPAGARAMARATRGGADGSL
jgi:branched-chain amino acid transport system permease protein